MSTVLNVLLLGTLAWVALLAFIMFIVSLFLLNEKAESVNQGESFRFWWNMWLIFTRILSVSGVIYSIFFLTMFCGIMANLPWG